MFPSTSLLEITPAELSERINLREKTPFHLIDCREENEFAFNQLPKAEWMPLSRFAEASAGLFHETPTELPTVVYCHHGVRSLQATHFLREKGVENTWSLAGGIDLWSVMIDPSVPRY